MADNQLELRDATKNLRLATEELQAFNKSTAAEIGGIVGKNLGDVTKKFTAGFEQLPGVQTLGSVGKTLFNKTFAKIKEKRELKLLQDRLGLKDGQMKELIQTKKVNDAQKKLNEQFKSGAEALLGVEVQFDKSLEKTGVIFQEAGKNFALARQEITGIDEKTGEALTELKTNSEDLTNVLKTRQEETAKFNDNLAKTFNENLAKQAAGNELGKENAKLLKTFGNSQQQMVDNQKEMIKAVDKPAEDQGASITNAFQGFADKLKIGDSFKEALEGQTATQSALDLKGKAKDKEIANEQTRADKRQENIFKRIAGNLGFLKDSAEEGQDENKGFFGNLIAKFAGFRLAIMGLPALFVTLKASLLAFGAALAPLAVPIAIGAAALIGFVAFIKGFIEGFGEGGFFGGVKEGLMEVFDWFVGFPLRLLKNLTTFVLRFLGFDALADDIDAAFEPFLSALRGIFGVLTDVLILPIVTIGRTIAGIFDGLIDILMAPINGLLTTIQSAFGGIMDIFEGIGMLFSGDIMGGLKMIFSGITDVLMAPIDGLIVFIKEIFGGLLTIITAPFKAIYDTLGDLFFNPTSHVASIVAWIGETFGGFFDFITKPFRGLYDLVAGIFTFDLEQIGNGIFKLIGGLFDIITYPFRSIFNLISSIFDFDFLGYLETLPGVKQVMGIIRGVAGFFTSDEEEDKAKAERDAAAKKARVSEKRVDQAQRRVDIVKTGNLQINGQNATPEQRAKMSEQYEFARDYEALDHNDNMNALREAQDRYAEIMNKTTLPELVSNAGESMRNALFGANENTIAKIEAEKEAALNKAEEFYDRQAFFDDEDKYARLQKIRDEYDVKIAAEEEKGVGMITSAMNFFDGLFDFDFMGLVKSIPGASKILGFLGFGGDTSLEDAIKDKEEQVASLQKDVNTDRFYETNAQKERDKLALVEAMKELEDMRAEQAGQVTVVNNNNVVNANTNTSNNQTTTVPLRDTTPPVGTLTPAYADF